MNILDAIILICLIPALIQGLKKGFISQVISIVSLIAGVWMSFEFSTAVSAWLAQYVEASEKLLKIASFAIIMIGVFIILGIVGKSLEGILKFVMLGWLNRLLGVAFAFIKTGLVIGIVIILFNSLNNSLNLVSEETLAQSVLYPPLKDMAYTIFPYLKEIFFWNA